MVVIDKTVWTICILPFQSLRGRGMPFTILTLIRFGAIAQVARTSKHGQVSDRDPFLLYMQFRDPFPAFPTGKEASRRSHMMSLKSKNELLEAVQSRYLKASKFEKQKILDEFTSATGYHRKHAIRLLKTKVQVQNRLRGKPKTYQRLYRGEV